MNAALEKTYRLSEVCLRHARASARKIYWEGVAGGNGPQRFSLALQAFSFLFRGVQRGYFSFSEGAQRDHERKRATDLGQRTSLARSRLQVADHCSMSDSAIYHQLTISGGHPDKPIGTRKGGIQRLESQRYLKADSSAH